MAEELKYDYERPTEGTLGDEVKRRQREERARKEADSSKQKEAERRRKEELKIGDKIKKRPRI